VPGEREPRFLENSTPGREKKRLRPRKKNFLPGGFLREKVAASYRESGRPVVKRAEKIKTVGARVVGPERVKRGGVGGERLRVQSPSTKTEAP